MLEKKFLHDLSSPLTCIQLNLENALALLGKENPASIQKGAALVNKALRQAQRAGKILEERKNAIEEVGEK